MKPEKINISCCGVFNIIIFLVFFLAKIFDKIDWSWWWVFSPLWIPAAIILGIVGLVALIYIIAGIIDFVCKYR